MQHLDEAHERAEERLAGWLLGKSAEWSALLVADVLGQVRVILWCPDESWESGCREINERLGEAAGDYWSRSVLRGRGQGHPDEDWQRRAWSSGRQHGQTGRLRTLNTGLSKAAWFDAPTEPPWTLGEGGAPAIVLFYSFVGGAGRSTALAIAALNLAAAGERVVVLDADLDGAGVGTLLAGCDGAVARYGIADYLLEQRLLGDAAGIPTDDYYHRHSGGGLAEAGDILVFPAGHIGQGYVGKVARINYGATAEGAEHPFVVLLRRVRRDLTPSWILVDSGAGLDEMAGLLTGGLCHVHVLLGTLAGASWRGLGLVVDRLGSERVRRGALQAECVLVASMVPRSEETRFRDEARGVFSRYYYAGRDIPGAFWKLGDLEARDAPHVPIVLPYEDRLATCPSFADVTDWIRRDGPYMQLRERLGACLRRATGRNG